TKHAQAAASDLPSRAGGEAGQEERCHHTSFKHIAKSCHRVLLSLLTFTLYYGAEAQLDVAANITRKTKQLTLCEGIPLALKGRRPGDLHSQPHHSRTQIAMASVARFPVLLRFWITIALLGYQFAGASLVLPAESHCARCAKTGAPGAVKPGMS